MKLRIKGDSIRLRLTQSEVRQFGNTGTITEKVHFGQVNLSYSLERKPAGDLNALYTKNHVRVYVPADTARNWIDTDQVGLETQVDLGKGKQLSILVEKDFQCLDARPDESDNFPNPKLGRKTA